MLLSIPSPSTGVWYLGPFPLRAYAVCIIAGIVVAMVIANRRWKARGGTADTLESVLVLGIPFGIIGARIYHVITDYELYFGPGRDPVDALKIWNGGLGIWGAVALGALGAYLVGRRRGVRFPALLDAVAPALLVAQAIGRLGNWFNSELFGRPTTLPWALEIAPQYRPDGYAGFDTFHPTFLYELLWNLAVAVVLVVLDRRLRLGHGKVFALYVLLYSAGRFWIEALRIDDVNEIGGYRLNNYTSALTFVAAALVLVWLHRNRPGREEIVETGRPDRGHGSDGAADETAAADGAPGAGTATTTADGVSPRAVGDGSTTATAATAGRAAGATALTTSGAAEPDPESPAHPGASTPGKAAGTGGGVG